MQTLCKSYLHAGPLGTTMKLISSSLASLSFDSLKSLAEYIDSIYLRSGFDASIVKTRNLPFLFHSRKKTPFYWGPGQGDFGHIEAGVITME